MSDSPRFWTSIRVFTVDLGALDNAKYINLVFRREHVGAGHFSPPPHERIRMGLNRRDVLKLGLFSSAALMLPAERLARAKLAVADRMPTSRLPKPFTVPFATPPVLEPTLRGSATDYYNIVQKQAGVEILPGYTTQIWGYNGITPGPTIKVEARAARRSSARPTTCPTSHPTLRYNVWTSVHLHGSASLPQYDGYASDITYPGAVQGLPVPQLQDGADPLVPRPRRAPHGGERLHGARRRCTSCTTTFEQASADPAGRVRRAADHRATRCSPATAS